MNQTAPHRPSTLLIVLAFIGFVSLGFPDALIGVAWPSIRHTFHLRQVAIGLIFAFAGLGYFITSFLSGRLTQILGIGLLLSISTALVASAMFGFAFAPMWVLFVACAVVHGLGSGAIDSGLNGYAANHLSARQMIWLHACYCFGAMLGPLVMTAVLAEGRPYSTGYMVVGSIMVAMSLLFLATYRQWGAISATAEHHGPPVNASHALRHSAVWLHMGVFFLYTGLEVTFSQWTYSVLTESRHVSPRLAGIAVGVYWGSIGTGRVIFGAVAERIGIDRLLRYSLLGAAAGALLFAIPLPVEAAFAGLAMIGIGLAPVFPCLMTRTPQRLGSGLSAHSIGFQVGAAMIGAAAVPATLGLAAGFAGLQAIPIGAVILAGVLTLLHEGLMRMPDVKPNTAG